MGFWSSIFEGSPFSSGGGSSSSSGGSKYSEKDAARDTGSSGKEVSRAWHSAREDANVRAPQPTPDQCNQGHRR